MEWLKNLWWTLQVKLFKKNIQPVDEAAVHARKRQMLEELNDGESEFMDDEVYDEKELAKIANQLARRRGNRTGYYIFGVILALLMIGVSVYNMITQDKPDIYILIQSDGRVEQSDIVKIEEFVQTSCSDYNGDGKVVVETYQVYLPAQADASDYNAVKTAIDEVFISYKVALCFGRTDFLTEVDAYRTLRELDGGEKTFALSETSLDIGANSPLADYHIGVRAMQRENDTYSDEAYTVYQNFFK